MAQQPLFRPYTGGIQPIQGQIEAGARIGQSFQQGLTNFGNSLAEGIKEYNKNSALNDQAAADAEASAGELMRTMSVFANSPEYAPLVAQYSGLLEKAKKAPTMGMTQRLSLANELKAARQMLGSDLQLYEVVKQKERQKALDDAAREAAGLGPKVPSFERRGNQLVDLPTTPLTKSVGGRTVDMTPSEFITQRTQELKDSGITQEELNDQLQGDLALAREAIGKAEGLEPAIRDEMLTSYYEAERELDTDFTGQRIFSSPDAQRATEVVGQELSQNPASENPVIKVAEENSQAFTSNSAYSKQVENDNKAKVDSGKGDYARKLVTLPDGRKGYEVHSFDANGAKIVLGAAGSFKEEREMLDNHRLANLPKYVAIVDAEARARGFAKGTEPYNNFVERARTMLDDALARKAFGPQTIKDASGKDIPNPEYAEAARVYNDIKSGNINMSEMSEEEASRYAWWIAVGGVGVGTIGADVAAQFLANKNPWGVIEKLSGGTIKSPKEFQNWVRSEQAKGVMAFDKKIQDLMDGKVKNLLDESSDVLRIGGKNVQWTWANGGRYIDSSGTVSQEVLDAASLRRNVENKKFTELWKQWKSVPANQNKPMPPDVRARLHIEADEAGRKAFEERARTGGFGNKTAAQIKTEILNAEKVALLKQEHPEIAARATDANGDIDLEVAKKELGEGAKAFEDKVERNLQESLSPSSKVAREAAEKRARWVKWTGGGGWKGILARGGAAAAAAGGVIAYDTMGTKTPAYKAIEQLWGPDGSVDVRIGKLKAQESYSKEEAERARTLRTQEAVRATRPAESGATTAPVLNRAPVLPVRRVEVPKYEQISRQEQINNLALQLQSRNKGITFGEASAIANQFVPQNTGPQMASVNGINFYGSDKEGWKPVPADILKASGGAGNDFNSTFYGRRTINPETNKIEIKPQTYSGFAIIGRKPEDPVDRRKMDATLIESSAAKRSIKEIREEIKNNPFRGGPFNIGGSNTAINQKYVLGLFKAALSQSGQDSRPSDLDVQNIMNSLARASDTWTTDRTALRALDDFERDLNSRLKDIAMQNNLQISIDGDKADLQDIEEQARKEQLQNR